MYAELFDVQEAYEQPISNDRQQWVEAKIGSAEIRLSSFIGDLSLHDAATVREVLVSAVCRVLRRPTGVTQDAETIGPYSHSTTVDPRVGAGSLWFTDEDLALFGITKTSMARTIRLRVPWRCP